MCHPVTCRHTQRSVLEQSFIFTYPRMNCWIESGGSPAAENPANYAGVIRELQQGATNVSDSFPAQGLKSKAGDIQKTVFVLMRGGSKPLPIGRLEIRLVI